VINVVDMLILLVVNGDQHYMCTTCYTNYSAAV